MSQASKDSVPSSPQARHWRRRGLFTAVGIGVSAAAIGIPVATASADGGWNNPAKGEITSGYKPPERPEHAGTDVANPQGTRIHAANAGTVTAIRTDSYPGDTTEGLLPGRTGNGVLIDHGDGHITYYGHLHTVHVAEGQEVKAGEHIAAMGTTGNSTGDHLHFEVHIDDATTDPYAFLEDQGVTLGESDPDSTDWPTMREGANGDSVKVIQFLLTAHGISTEADGDFASVTVTAVEDFQEAKDLETSGNVGPETWTALITEVSEGADSDSAKAAQSALNIHGAGLEVDGDFGSVSVEATKAFQGAQGIDADGVVNEDTWKALI